MTCPKRLRTCDCAKFDGQGQHPMMIGVRIVLLLGVIVVLAPLIAWFVTRNPKFYRFAIKSAKIIAASLAAIGLIYLAERLILIL